MKITNVDVIQFKSTEPVGFPPHRWSYATYALPSGTDPVPPIARAEDYMFGPGVLTETTKTITRISTDEGIEGYALGGNKTDIERAIKPLLIGEDPLDREKFWVWMEQIVAYTHTMGGKPALSEATMNTVDMALWDLFGRMVNLPIHKILGGCRDQAKCYASTFPNLGKPEDYAENALECKQQGYKAYKIHAYICWNPHTWEAAPQLPGFPKEDVEVCRAVREAVGDDLVLMLDPFGVYTLEEAIWVGRELEKLNFYWLEMPMVENKIEAYRRLCRELDIAICSPEAIAGGVSARAEWILQGAADILRIGRYEGGITGCYKLINICQAHGIKCELHGGGWSDIQLMGATHESTCEYYERGLVRPGWDNDTPPLYLKATCDPMDADGNVIVPQTPGLGMVFNWDFINENRVTSD